MQAIAVDHMKRVVGGVIDICLSILIFKPAFHLEYFSQGAPRGVLHHQIDL